MNKFILVIFSIISTATFAQNNISADQLWADQQCGGAAAFKKDEKKFNECVNEKMAKSKKKPMEVSADQLWADQQCGGAAAYKQDEKKFNECVSTKMAKPKNNPEDLLSQPEYMAGCRKMILENDPSKDPIDVEMLCNDPYLNGKPNASYEDEVRRKRLIRETNAAKEQVLEKHVSKPSSKEGSKNAGKK